MKQLLKESQRIFYKIKGKNYIFFIEVSEKPWPYR